MVNYKLTVAASCVSPVTLKGTTDRHTWSDRGTMHLFQEKGAIFKSGGDWGSCVAQGGKLMTGQNPQSSEALANALVSALGA